MGRDGFSVQHPQHLKPPSLHSTLGGEVGGGVTSAACFLCESLNDPNWSRHNPPPPLLCQDTIAPRPTWTVLMVKQSWFFYWLMQIFKLQVVGQWPVGVSVYVGLCYFIFGI